jgi:xanthine/uracil permease
LAGNLARFQPNIEQRSCHRQACGTRLVSSVSTAGIFGIVAAPFISRLLPLFPPVLTGTIILVIGISLMRQGSHGGRCVIDGGHRRSMCSR